MRAELIAEAARLFCEDALTDYRGAVEKAAQRLGLENPRGRVDARVIESAVLEYQQLFGGEEYRERLRALRETAVRALRLLDAFTPRLVGALISGAITAGHRVQLHAFADKAEAVDLLLEQKRIAFEVGERRYRYADGGTADIPVLSFGEDENGVDVAIFPEDEVRRSPLSSVTQSPARRWSLKEAEAHWAVERPTPPAR